MAIQPTKPGKSGLQGECKRSGDALARLEKHLLAGHSFASFRCEVDEQLDVVRRASAFARAHFEAMVASRPMLQPAEAAAALNCDLRTVARLFDARELRGIQFSTGNGERMTRRIERWSVCSLLIRKANYTVEDHLVCVVKFLNALTEPERAVVLASVKWTDAKPEGEES